MPGGRNPIGYGMCAPTILTLGSEAQRQRYLRPLFTCEEIWCQLFSEPGAGSDVASLATRAQRDGDEWILNGQKVWTTLAHRASFGVVLARSDPEAEKHRGITYFVVDMKAPGVEVRPLRQATGDAEFNEVFFTDVRIPDNERLGDVGDGWRGALVTLMNERVSIGGAGVHAWRWSDRNRRPPLEPAEPRAQGRCRQGAPDAPLGRGRGAAHHQRQGGRQLQGGHARS